MVLKYLGYEKKKAQNSLLSISMEGDLFFFYPIWRDTRTWDLDLTSRMKVSFELVNDGLDGTN